MESAIYKVIIFAGVAAIGNAIFVFGQRSSTVSSNPFLFMTGSVTLCAALFIVAALMSDNSESIAYLKQNVGPIIIAAIGFFITFIGFYLMYSRVGAHSYTVYAVLSILTTSVFVGMVIFRESFNAYHVASIGLAVMAVFFYAYGQLKMAE
jgi:drug/metabolite transporter (DMT)-like permease